MKIKFALLLVFFYFPLPTMACDCSPVTLQNRFVQNSYYKADIIFLGIVESVNDESVIFSVVEVLKGQDKKSTLTISNTGSCAIVPKKNEMWLIYLERLEQKNEYSTNLCLPNRNYGINNHLKRVPSPFLSKEDNLYNSFEKHKEILLSHELNNLRQKRVLNELKTLKKNYSYLQYVVLVMGLLLAIIILYAIKWK